MNAVATPVLMDADDLLAMPDGKCYELIDGIPVEKIVGAKSELIATRLAGWLEQFCREHRFGHVFGGATGYRCWTGKNGRPRVRKPDASVVRAGRFPDGEVPEGDIAIPPDLAVEVLSPNDKAEELEQKLADYRQAKVRLVWVVSPWTRTVRIRRGDDTSAFLDESGTLSGEDVIPGFACKVADLFV
jgi:Uma2 family endonuclease